MTLQSKMQVWIFEYEASHAKQPRGRGTWAFAIGWGRKRWLGDLFWFTGSYSDARKAAIAHARANSCHVVSVQP